MSGGLRTFLIDFRNPDGGISSARLEARDFDDAAVRFECLAMTGEVVGELAAEGELAAGQMITQVGRA